MNWTIWLRSKRSNLRILVIEWWKKKKRKKNPRWIHGCLFSLLFIFFNYRSLSWMMMEKLFFFSCYFIGDDSSLYNFVLAKEFSQLEGNGGHDSDIMYFFKGWRWVAYRNVFGLWLAYLQSKSVLLPCTPKPFRKIKI